MQVVCAPNHCQKLLQDQAPPDPSQQLRSAMSPTCPDVSYDFPVVYPIHVARPDEEELYRPQASISPQPTMNPSEKAFLTALLQTVTNAVNPPPNVTLRCGAVDHKHPCVADHRHPCVADHRQRTQSVSQFRPTQNDASPVPRKTSHPVFCTTVERSNAKHASTSVRPGALSVSKSGSLRQPSSHILHHHNIRKSSQPLMSNRRQQK